MPETKPFWMRTVGTEIFWPWYTLIGAVLTLLTAVTLRRWMGSAGDSPAPVGDSPTGTRKINFADGPSLSSRNVASVPSGESPDGTGVSPVLPARSQSKN